MINKKRIMVDMSATLIHYGHVRILKKASKYGKVIVALTRDKDIKKYKGYTPEMNYSQRKKIIKSIRYVDKIVSSKFILNDKFLDRYKINFLVHGNDNKNKINKKRLLIFKRTKNISTTILRKRAFKCFQQISGKRQ